MRRAAGAGDYDDCGPYNSARFGLIDYLLSLIMFSFPEKTAFCKGIRAGIRKKELKKAPFYLVQQHR
jgi:hypothetical protein